MLSLFKKKTYLSNILPEKFDRLRSKTSGDKIKDKICYNSFLMRLFIDNN